MEAVRPRGRGRPPKKCPRIELREDEDTNIINAADEPTETSAENNGSDGSNSAPIPASEDSIKNNNTVAMEAAAAAASAPDLADPSSLADHPASTHANDGLPSARVINPRRRPRKGIPKRSPFY